jgi:hypothetical protein
MIDRRNLRRLHVVLFAAVLIAWTAALLAPLPDESAKKVLGSPWRVFLFGQGLHTAAYAFLTVLGGTVGSFGRKWVWVLPGLLAHGGATEILQPLVGRTFDVSDLALDALGVALGGLVVVGCRIRSSRRGSAEASSPESSGPG